MVKAFLLSLYLIIGSWEAQAAEPACTLSNTIERLSRRLDLRWNIGHVRSFGMEARFWSAPVIASTQALARIRELTSHCEVRSRGEAGNFLLIGPSPKLGLNATSPAGEKPESSALDETLSIGLLKISEQEQLIIAYPARILLAPVLGSKSSHRSAILSYFENPTLLQDMEYNFQDTHVRLLTAAISTSMSQATARVFKSFLELGYQPRSEDEEAIQKVLAQRNGDSHASLWRGASGWIALNVSQESATQVRINIHEVRQIPAG